MMNKARIIVVTGDGKGKTTSALGIILRAIAYRKRVLLARFCKATTSGELAILARFPEVDIQSSACGMTPPPDHPDFPAHVQAARNLFTTVVTNAPTHDLIVMDEICGAVARNLISEKEVLDFLATLRPDQAAVLTGRGATPALIAAADTVSDITCIKHGYTQGIAAQEGIEK